MLPNDIDNLATYVLTVTEARDPFIVWNEWITDTGVVECDEDEVIWALHLIDDLIEMR